MADQPLFSVCIPAYKRTAYVRRLLDSISIQTMKDFEVVLTDDSGDDEVQKLVDSYRNQFEIRYFRNDRPLGTPENWNESIRKANGKWIKMMHDDDWFSSPGSLQGFAERIAESNGPSFIFSAFNNVTLDTGEQESRRADPSVVKMLRKDPATLFAGNLIGPPSVVLHKNDRRVLYDSKLKWLVDIDFYIRSLSGHSPSYIDQVLINVGIGEQQVTTDCFLQRPVEIPENFYLLNKVGAYHLKTIRVYDAFWRLMRNLKITSEREIVSSGYSGRIPPVIRSMIAWQSLIPADLLSNGVFSKVCMFLHFLLHFRSIDRP
jgi:glycosyltransferase involved in cell wall biosynthesis